jgi:hypothetical protein
MYIRLSKWLPPKRSGGRRASIQPWRVLDIPPQTFQSCENHEQVYVPQQGWPNEQGSVQWEIS